MLPPVQTVTSDETITAYKDPKDDAKMRSRIGKKTDYDFAILREKNPDDMIKMHKRHMRKLEARGPYKHIVPEKLAS